MHLLMDIDKSVKYKSKSQKARVISEDWTCKNILCPACGNFLVNYANNAPVADFFCPKCANEFELKATSKKFGATIPDGAYETMIERLSSQSNPNLMIMQYDPSKWTVKNLFAVPKYFFSPNIIIKRPPLPPTAKRAGWIGCNIKIGQIPAAGKIEIISNGKTVSHSAIIAKWNKTVFLKEIINRESKGWLLRTMQCIDMLGLKTFSLNDIYKYEKLLEQIYPNNKHIKEKLRQQLQILRDKGYLKFLDKGVYELTD